MGKNPSSVMITFVASKVASLLLKKPETEIDVAISEVVESKDKYKVKNWSGVKPQLIDKIEELMDAEVPVDSEAKSSKGKSQKQVNIDTSVPANLVAPLKLKIKGRADVEFQKDSSFIIKGGKKIGIKCDDDSDPFLEEISDGAHRGGCTPKVEEK